MRKINQSSRFNDKNAFRKWKIYIFQISAVRTGVCAYMDATPLGFAGKNTMIMAWESHEESMKIPLIFNASWPMKKLKQTKKKPMKMSWNKMGPTMFFFHGFLMIMKKPWIEKLFFIVSGFMGFSWRFSNSCPIKKPWVFRERLNINVHEKWNGFWWNFHYPCVNYTPGLLFMGKTETATMKI